MQNKIIRKKLSLEQVQWLISLGCINNIQEVEYYEAMCLLNKLKVVMFYPTHHHGTGYEGWSIYGEIGTHYLTVEDIEPQKTIEEAVIKIIDYLFETKMIEYEYKLLNIVNK